MSKRGRIKNRQRREREADLAAAPPRAPRPEPRSAEVIAHATRGNNRWDALDQVAEVIELERSVIARRDRTVRRARAAGATWTDLARVLGVSPQAVQQRYGRPGVSPE